jgi:hypothetical protein
MHDAANYYNCTSHFPTNFTLSCFAMSGFQVKTTVENSCRDYKSVHYLEPIDVLIDGPQALFDRVMNQWLELAAASGCVDSVRVLTANPSKWVPGAGAAGKALCDAAQRAHPLCVEALLWGCPQITPRDATRALEQAITGLVDSSLTISKHSQSVVKLLADSRVMPAKALMHFVKHNFDGRCVRVLLAPELGWMPSVELAETALRTAAMYCKTPFCVEALLELCPHITTQACSEVLDAVALEPSPCLEVLQVLLKDNRVVPSTKALLTVLRRGNGPELCLFAPYIATVFSFSTL